MATATSDQYDAWVLGDGVEDEVVVGGARVQASVALKGLVSHVWEVAGDEAGGGFDHSLHAK